MYIVIRRGRRCIWHRHYTERAFHHFGKNSATAKSQRGKESLGKNSPNSLSDLALWFSPSTSHWLNPNRREQDKASHRSQPSGPKTTERRSEDGCWRSNRKKALQEEGKQASYLLATYMIRKVREPSGTQHFARSRCFPIGHDTALKQTNNTLYHYPH